MGNKPETRRRKHINWEQYRYISERPFHTSDAAAARALGISDSAVGAWNADPEFQAMAQAFIDGQLEDSRRQLMVLRDKAVVQLAGLLDSRDVRTRLRAVTEVLNRCGMAEVFTLDLSPALAKLLAESAEEEKGE